MPMALLPCYAAISLSIQGFEIHCRLVDERAGLSIISTDLHHLTVAILL